MVLAHEPVHFLWIDQVVHAPYFSGHSVVTIYAIVQTQDGTDLIYHIRIFNTAIAFGRMCAGFYSPCSGVRLVIEAATCNTSPLAQLLVGCPGFVHHSDLLPFCR